ncbi:hypothetical protein BIW11_04445, partial [Tropilaelaps mercedesae]
APPTKRRCLLWLKSSGHIRYPGC